MKEAEEDTKTSKETYQLSTAVLNCFSNFFFHIMFDKICYECRLVHSQLFILPEENHSSKKFSFYLFDVLSFRRFCFKRFVSQTKNTFRGIISRHASIQRFLAFHAFSVCHGAQKKLQSEAPIAARNQNLDVSHKLCLLPPSSPFSKALCAQ